MLCKTVNRMRKVPLKLFQVLHLHAEIWLNIPKQCPGIIFKKITKTRLIILLKPLRKRGIEDIEERGVRERENRNESFIHDARWANQRSLVPASSSVPMRVTQSVP